MMKFHFTWWTPWWVVKISITYIILIMIFFQNDLSNGNYIHFDNVEEDFVYDQHPWEIRNTYSTKNRALIEMVRNGVKK